MKRFQSVLHLLALCAILGLPIHSFSQSNPVSTAFELQVYPTGIIPGIRFAKKVNDLSQVHLRLGYNWIRHRDLGVHDDERGDGFGFTIGYEKYFSAYQNGWFGGIRSDIWWNSLDWRDGQDPNATFGQTNITVVQPTLIAGYDFGNSKGISLTPTIGFGWEWNVKTEGEPTGEGAILLLGVIVNL